MRENARVTSEYKGDFQELVDEISELLGVPATLENRDFELIAFGAYDSEDELDASALDPVRARSILTRRSTAAVRTWFEGFGITRATGPVRIPRRHRWHPRSRPRNHRRTTGSRGAPASPLLRTTSA